MSVETRMHAPATVKITEHGFGEWFTLAVSDKDGATLTFFINRERDAAFLASLKSKIDAVPTRKEDVP